MKPSPLDVRSRRWSYLEAVLRNGSRDVQVAGFLLLVIGQMIYGEMLKAGGASVAPTSVPDPWALLSTKGGGADTTFELRVVIGGSHGFTWCYEKSLLSAPWVAKKGCQW